MEHASNYRRKWYVRFKNWPSHPQILWTELTGTWWLVRRRSCGKVFDSGGKTGNWWCAGKDAGDCESGEPRIIQKSPDRCSHSGTSIMRFWFRRPGAEPRSLSIGSIAREPEDHTLRITRAEWFRTVLLNFIMPKNFSRELTKNTNSKRMQFHRLADVRTCMSNKIHRPQCLE